MNVLHVITRYNRIKENWRPTAPRVNIFVCRRFAYYMAKHIIHLIKRRSESDNNDPQIGDKAESGVSSRTTASARAGDHSRCRPVWSRFLAGGIRSFRAPVQYEICS